MRTNKQLKEIGKELDRVKVMLADLANGSLDYNGVISRLYDVKTALGIVRDRFDRVDKVWARDRLANQIHTELNLSIENYNKVKQAVAERFAKAGDKKQLKDIETAFNATDIPYGQAESRSLSMHSYINNSNNGRTGDRLVRVATKAGALLGVVGLGGAVFTLIYQNDKYNDLNNQYNQLQNDYVIVGTELDEVIAEKEEWKNKYQDSLNGSGSVSKEDYDKLQGDYNELQGDYTELQGEYNAMKSEYEALQGEYDAIMALIPEGSSVAEYISGLKSQIDTLETTITGLESAKSALENRVNSLEEQLKAAESDGSDNALIETLSRQLAESQAQYAALDATHKATIKAHNDKVAEFETTIDGLNKQLADEKGINDKLTAENGELKNENSELKTENGALKNENSNLKTENGELKTENAEWEAKYEAIDKEIDTLYSNLVGGTETEPLAQLNEISSRFEYYADLASQGVLTQDEVNEIKASFVSTFVSIGGNYSELQNMDLKQLAEWLRGQVNASEKPSETPSGSVHESGSGNTGSIGSTDSSTEEDKDLENDGTTSVTPDIPVRGE